MPILPRPGGMATGGAITRDPLYINTNALPDDALLIALASIDQQRHDWNSARRDQDDTHHYWIGPDLDAAGCAIVAELWRRGLLNQYVIDYQRRG